MALTTLTTQLGQVAAAAAGNTVTLAAPPAGASHSIAYIEIICYTTVARTGVATPVTVTTTNLGGLQWTFSTAAAVGTQERAVFSPAIPMVATASGTATTIVCPATTSVIWTVNVVYMAG